MSEQRHDHQCDCCGKMAPRLHHVTAYGIETYACDECAGYDPKPTARRTSHDRCWGMEQHMSDREAKAGPYILRFRNGDMARLFCVEEDGTQHLVAWGNYFPAVVQFAGELLKYEAQIAMMRNDALALKTALRSLLSAWRDPGPMGTMDELSRAASYADSILKEIKQ